MMRRIALLCGVVALVVFAFALAGCSGGGQDEGKVSAAAKPKPPPAPPVTGTILGWKYTKTGEAALYTMPAGGGTATLLTAPGASPAWGPNGQVCYNRDNRIWTLVGGTATQFTTGGEPVQDPVWTDPPRAEHPTNDGDGQPVWSPDGSKIAFVRALNSWATPGGLREVVICVKEVASGVTRQLSVYSQDYAPAWSPDSTRVLLTQREAGLCVAPADGSVPPVPIADTVVAYAASGVDWYHPASGADRLTWSNGGVFCADLDGAGLVVPESKVTLVPGPPWASHPTWSPDGTFVAYEYTTYKGNTPVYHTCLVEVATKKVTDVGSLSHPDWGP